MSKMGTEPNWTMVVTAKEKQFAANEPVSLERTLTAYQLVNHIFALPPTEFVPVNMSK